MRIVLLDFTSLILFDKLVRESGAMEKWEGRLSILEAKAIDLVDYLNSIGIQPVKIKGSDYWYLSPIRTERTASFKINRKLNRWYDHGIGKGGNLIDFGILFFNCSVGEFMQRLNNGFVFNQPRNRGIKQVDSSPSKIIISEVNQLKSPSLISYLKSRKIQLQIAEKYCEEVTYLSNQKTYYGIGFKNDSGGYEIRNPYYKVSSTPKDLRTLQTDLKASESVLVFEGFMDFLSYQSLPKSPIEHADFIVLNSLSFFEKARPKMESYQSIILYLDNDKAGKNVSKQAIELNNNYTDGSNLYEGYKDLNNWLINNDGKFEKVPHPKLIKTTLRNKL